MVHSVRARLALWYAGVYSVFLIAFAVAAYLFLRQSSLARINEFLAETASAVTGAMEFERNAGKSDSVAVTDVVREFRLRETDVVVLDRTSGTLFHARADLDPTSTSARVTTVPIVSDMEVLMRATPRDRQTWRTVREGDETLRVYTMPYQLGLRTLVIGTVQPLRAQEKLMRETGAVFLIAVPIFLAFTTLGGYALARKSLAPVASMTERAAVIGASSLHERLPLGNPRDELGRLAAVFNDLLDRLERAFAEQRRFMADASHELRTPVAVISGESELALSRTDRRPEELRDALAAVRAESRRLRSIVDDLFLLAQAEGRAPQVRREDLYLRDIVEECARAARSLAAAREIELAVDAGDDDLPISGDETLLKRAVMNLLDNAVKYTPMRGRVSVRARRDDGKYAIDVEDSGPGVAPDERDQIFERFYRGASLGDGTGASRATSGAGLGLAITRWVARAHQGDAELVRTGAGGSVFRLTLPAPLQRPGPDGTA